MKVLLVIERFDPARGGAERYAADLAARLAASGVEVAVAAASFRSLPPGVRAVPVRTVPGPKAVRVWDFARRCARLAPAFDLSHALGKAWGVDVLHPHGGSHKASLRGLSRSVESPAPRWASGLLRAASLRQAVFRRMEARMFGPGGARAVLAVSRMVAADLAELHGVPPGRTRVLYNPVDTARFHPGVVSARGRIRDLHGIPRGALVCLFSAHHFRLKGLYPLLRAAARRGPKAPFVLVLGGGRKAPWERLAVRLGLGGRVVFAGSSAEPEAYYGAADAFVLPTFYDPCSLSVLEAMACALPVVTSRWNGASEWIEHGREGWILDDPSRDDLLASTLEELEDPGRRRETGGRARARVLGLSPDAHLESVLNVYGDVMAEKAGRRA